MNQPSVSLSGQHSHSVTSLEMNRSLFGSEMTAPRSACLDLDIESTLMYVFVTEDTGELCVKVFVLVAQ